MPDSFGSELRAIDLDRIRISETLIPRGLRIDRHAHSAGQICFVLEGEYEERFADGERLLRPGMMHVRAPGRVHANAFAPDDDVLALVVSIQTERWIGRPFEGPARLLEELAREIRSELHRDDDIARHALESLAVLALSRMVRAAGCPAREPVWLADAVAMVDDRFAEPLSLTVIARRLAVDRGRLAAAFRRHRGSSVGEAIRAARIRSALAMLATNRPLAEIAVTSGFHDQPHFTRVFRASVGITPAEFRRRTSR